MYGAASACGSATVVNGIATGKGAAFGIDLRVNAEVKLSPELKGIVGRISGARDNPKLIEICVRRTLKYFKKKNLGAVVTTTSEVPIAVGLSSSSAAANAAVLATFAALRKRIDPKLVLKIAIDSAFEAGVTVTGALDDAAASLYGYGVVTNNLRRRIIKSFKVDPSLKVVVYVPLSRFYTSKLKGVSLKGIEEGADVAHELASRGRIWDALTLNGLLYSSALQQDPSPALEALANGALAAGLTGTGSATVAVAKEGPASKIALKWRNRQGRVILISPARKGWVVY